MAYNGDLRCAKSLLISLHTLSKVSIQGVKPTWFAYKLTGQNRTDYFSSLRGVQIATHICCALGQKELFNYFVTELSISINILAAPISAEFLVGKQIPLQFSENSNLDFVDPIELVVMLNQYQFLQFVLERIAVTPSFGYMWIYPDCILPRVQFSKSVSKQSKEIEASFRQIIKWVILAAKFGACECAAMLLCHFPSEIAKGLYLAHCIGGADYRHTGAVQILRYAFMQGARMFALFESLEEIVMPVLTVENFGMNDWEHYSPTPYHSLDFNYIFSKVEESIQYMATVTENENCENSYVNMNLQNLPDYSKQSCDILFLRPENMGKWRRHMFHLVIGCRAPFEVLYNALQQYSNICRRMQDSQDARNSNNTLFSYCTLEENFLHLMLNGFRKLVQFENGHPAIWLHVSIQDGSYYRVPPVYFLFATGLRMLFSIRIPENTLPNFYSRLYVPHSAFSTITFLFR